MTRRKPPEAAAPPPSSDLDALIHAARQLTADVGALTRRACDLGLASPAPFGSGGRTDSQQATSQALWVLHIVSTMLQGYIGHGEDWPILRDEVRQAANVLRGGKPERVVSEPYRVCVNSLEVYAWARNPPLSRTELAVSFRNVLVSVFGSSFERLDPSELATKVEEMRLRVTRALQRAMKRGEAVDVYAVRRREAVTAVTNAVWQVFRELREGGLRTDRESFRCPLPWDAMGTKTSPPAPTRSALHESIREALRH